VNSLLVLLYIPLFNGFAAPAALRRALSRMPGCGCCLAPYSFPGLYGLLARHVSVGPLRRIGAGLFLTAVPFLLSALVESWIEAGHTPSIGWQLLGHASRSRLDS